MKHEHVWVKVWSNGVRNIYQCDIRGRSMPAKKFCGELGYDVRERVFDDRLDRLVEQRLLEDRIAYLRQREFGAEV
jgi:hypothetical protein